MERSSLSMAIRDHDRNVADMRRRSAGMKLVPCEEGLRHRHRYGGWLVAGTRKMPFRRLP